MAKRHNNKGRSKNPDGKYTALHEWILNSHAWKSLDVFSRCVYFEVKRKYNGSNNGAISASVRELKSELNCSDKPITRSLRTLKERGFLIEVQKGSFNWKTKIDNKEKNRASVWLLTELPQDEPTKQITPTKNFMKWRPDDDPDGTKKNKNTVVQERPYDRRGTTIRDKSPPKNDAMVVQERPFNANSLDTWSLSYDTYNIPYTPPRIINKGED